MVGELFAKAIPEEVHPQGSFPAIAQLLSTLLWASLLCRGDHQGDLTLTG
jgi:hypothetical protein